MKIVVIGGSGFLGSHVADHLSQAGNDVTVYDHVPSVWTRPDQKMIVGDISDFPKLLAIMKGADVVYNFAAIADLDQARNQPLLTADVNILGNVSVLEACRVSKVKRFIFASTVYVYSRVGSFYRCSKQAAELFVEEYQKMYGLDFTILRYGSLYGPRSDESNGMYRIVSTALESGKIKFTGHIDTMREYIHVEDAARASVLALDEKFRNESIVLTGQEPMKVLDMLRVLAEILGVPTDEIDFENVSSADHYTRTPYAYQPKMGRKYIPSLHVDLGQGLLQLVEEIVSEIH